MSTNQQHSVEPFPIAKFANLRVTDNFIIDADNNVIGYMQPYELLPTDINKMDIEPDEIEDLIKRGFIYPGYKHWFVNNFGLPVEPVELDGYPEDTVTRDMWNYYYFKNICIGSRVKSGIAPVEGEDIERLDVLGIEYSHLYGIEQKPKVYVNSSNFIYGYKIHPTSSMMFVDEQIIVTEEDKIAMIGQVVDGRVVKLSTELIDKYTKLGCKMADPAIIELNVDN